MEKDSFKLRQQRKNKNNKLPMLAIAIVAVFVIAIGTVAVILLSHSPSVSEDPPFSTDVPPAESTPASTESDAPFTRKDGYYTFLFAGVDKISMNTDVLMLASLDTNKGEIHMVQIPRDTFINREVGGYSSFHRVNAVFTAAYNKQRAAGATESKAKHLAMQDLQKRLSEALCVNIDEYVLINTEGFRNVIDTVGGVYYNVPRDMDYEDPEQELYIHLKKGEQLLDGDKSEQLIRYRKDNEGGGYSTGDLERVSLRGDFMISAMKQVKAKIGIMDMIGLVPTLKNHVSTSMSVGDMVFYAKALYAVSDDAVESHRMSGATVRDPETGEWKYYALNKKAALNDINRYLNVYKSDIDPSLFDAAGFFTDRKNSKFLYINDYYLS